VDHALKASALQYERTMRLADSVTATARLFAFGMNADAWNDLWQMQSAVRGRMSQLQKNWVQGWFAWMRYADQIEGANTMSKLAEREFNIMAQAAGLFGEQSTSLIALMENIEVDYLYWLNQK
jgi:hypothetical protein